MVRLRAEVLFSVLLGLFAAGPAVRAADSPRTPRELIQYIEDAKRLGLKDSEIRQNAVAAGWGKELVDDALVIARYLNDQSIPGSGAAGPRKPVEEPAGYRIGAGDVLQIAVFKEPEASVPSVTVRPDGMISMPIIREVEAAGLTPTELEKVLTEKLSKFIRDADVTVIPREINSQKVYLVGAVRREGPIALAGAMTVLQVINAGGGLTDYAKRSRIYILRNENGRRIRLPFDYKAVIRGEKQEQNVLVRPDDTIVVP